MRQYVANKVICHEKDPLKFWEENKVVNKALASVATKFLCVLATSVPAERVFSKAGLVLTYRRNRLKPHVVDKIIFCKRNIWLLNVNTVN